MNIDPLAESKRRGRRDHELLYQPIDAAARASRQRWGIVVGVAFAPIALSMLAIAIEERVSRPPLQHQEVLHIAYGWLSEMQLEALASCNHVAGGLWHCDVVPLDARPPFRLSCVRDGCHLTPCD